MKSNLLLCSSHGWKSLGLVKILIMVFFVVGSQMGKAQLLIPDDSPVTQNFDGMGSSATATLPTGFRVSQGVIYSAGTTETTQAAGTTGDGILASNSTGGTYNFANGVTASSTDRALGFLNSGGFTSPRSIMLELQNTTGLTITELEIEFDFEKYRSGTRAWDWTFFSGTDGSTWTARTDGDQSYAADANNTTIFNPPTTTDKSLTITGLSIADGESFYLRWTLTGDGGSTNGQAIGIDNFSITATLEASSSVSYSWNGGAGDWTDPTKWTPNGVPGAIDDATIGSGTVSLTADQEVFNLDLTGILTGSFDLDILGDFNFSGGELGDGIATGTVTVTGETNVTTDVANYVRGKSLVLNGGGTLNGHFTIFNGGSVTISSGETLSSISPLWGILVSSGGGTLINNGSLIRNAPGNMPIEVDFESTGTVSLASGDFAFNGVSTFTGGNLDIPVGRTVTFGGGVGITHDLNDVTISSTASVILSNSGTEVNIDAESSGMFTNLTINSGCTFSSETDIEISNEMSLSGTFSGDVDLTVDGNMTLSGGVLGNNGNTAIGGDLMFGNSGAIGDGVVSGNVTIEGTLTVSNAVGFIRNKTVTLNGGGTLEAQLTIYNGGSVIVPEGQVLTSNTTNNNIFTSTGGGSLINNGTFLRLGSGTLNIVLPFTNTGTISGTTGISIQDVFTNTGTIAPGASVGELNITIADLTNEHLEIEIEGDSGPGTGHDRLNVTGNFIADGTLEVLLLDDYTPADNTSFQIVSTTGTVTGTFDVIDWPTPEEEWDIAYETDFITITYLGGAEVTGPVIVTATVGNTGPVAYTTLKESFDAVNDGTHQGDIIMDIYEDLTETVSAVLNASGAGAASYTSILIKPDAGSPVSVSGAIAGHLIDLNGADNVTIDGLNTGGNSLTISNTATGASSAIRFIADASDNTIQNCTIQGSATTVSNGVILFSTGTTTGNDGNTINDCNITSAGANLPINGIFSSGTSAVIDNSENTLHANHISDFFNATGLPSGINLASTGNSTWTITDNRLFQTETRLFTAAGIRSAILVGTGSGYTISGNVVGFANAAGTGMTIMVGNSVPLAGTFPGAWNNTGSANASRYIAINCAFSAGGTTSNIQGNTIAGFAMYTSSGATTANGIWCGINVTSGNVNIGTITGNTIGATSGQGSIYTAASTAGGAAVGIYVTSANTVNIQNNTIGAIDAAGAVVASGCGGITGIDVAGAGTYTISNNTIGNNAANNLRAGNLATGSTLSNTGTFVTTSGVGAIVGIRSSATGGPLNITDNTLRGFAMSSTSSSGSSTFTGITNTGAATSAINIVDNLLGTAEVGLVNYAFAIGASSALTGINCSAGAAAAPLAITGNNIRGITYTTSGSNPHIYIGWNHGTSVTDNISNNTFTNLNVNTSGSVTFLNRGTTSMTATGVSNINSNSIVTGFNKGSAGGTVTFYTIGFGGTSPNGSVMNENLNDFSNVTLTGSTAVLCWSNSEGASGSSGPTKTISNNIFNNISTGAGLFTGVTVNFSGAGSSVSNNTISNLSTGAAITGIVLGSSNQGLFTIAGNIIDPITSTGGAIMGISNAIPGAANINNNEIFGLSTSGGAFAAEGIVSTAGTTVNIFRNKIYNIQSSNASGTVNGIRIGGGTTYNVYNNLIGDLQAPATSSATDAIRGINITSTATNSSINVSFNTIYLNATSSGVDFNTSGIFHTASTTATTAALTLKNNIIVNNSTPNGAGRSVAFRRSSGAANALNNYSSASNNNLFFAGTLGGSPNQLIYADGTSTAQSLADYKSGVFTAGTIAPRDDASITENPTFLSTTGADADFLHIDESVPTQIESAGMPVAGIEEDFDGDMRNETTPDIGADEFDGMQPEGCVGTPTAGMITGDDAVCTGSGTTLTLAGATEDVGISYQWYSGTDQGGPYPNSLGTGLAQVTGNLMEPTYFVVEVTCDNGGGMAVTNEKEILINPLPDVMVNPTSASICFPDGMPVDLTASGADTYSWSPAAGLSATTGDMVTANPSSTTLYTVTGTDANGCANTATATITVSKTPLQVMAMASPESICEGTTTNLTSSGYVPTSTTVNNYIFATTTGAALDPMIGATTIIGSGIDDTPSSVQSLPFTFNYHGTDVTQFSVSPDGWMLMGGAAATAQFTNSVTSTTNIPKIYPLWDDLHTGTTGGVSSVTIGTAPYRIFIVQWFVTVPRSTSGPANATFQCWLYETLNSIEFRYGTIGTAASASGGLTGSATQYQSLTFSSNTSSSVTANNNNTITPASGRMYTITSPSAALSYAWDPADDVMNPNSQNTESNPLTETTLFTVTISNEGCSSTATAEVMIDPLTCDDATTDGLLCGNTDFTITAQTSGGGAPFNFAWDDGEGGIYPNAQMITVNLPPGDYTFTATISDDCGSMCTSSVSFTVLEQPDVSVSPEAASICNPGGSEVDLTASGADTYSWSPAAGLSATTGDMVTANPATTTLYTVTGTDANGCTNTAEALISVGPAIEINSVIADPSTICEGDDAILTATLTADAPTYCASTHSSGSCGFSEGDKISLVVLNTLSNPSGCVVNPGYTDFTAGPTTTLAISGNPYTLSVTVGGDANQHIAAWIDYNQDGVFDPTTEFLGQSGNVGANGTANLMFSVPGGALNGPTRLRVIGGNDSAILSTQSCGASSSSFGETEDYTVTISGGSDPFTYEWSPGTFLSSTSTNPTTAVAVTATTMYNVTVTSSDGCTATGSTTINVNPLPSAPSCPDPLIVCQEDAPFDLTQGQPPGGAFSGTGVTGSMFDPAIAGAGIHTITYTVTDGNDCSNFCEYTITVISADDCNATSSMRWVLLPSGDNGSCTSDTDCCEDILCYGLEYTPRFSGILNNYTTGFFADCIGLDLDMSAVLSNASCVLDPLNDLSVVYDECEALELVLIIGSGYDGVDSVFAGVPKIIQQVCFSVPVGETILLDEDEITDLAMGIDLFDDGGSVTDYPDYTNFLVERTAPEEVGGPVPTSAEVIGFANATPPTLPVVTDQCGTLLDDELISIVNDTMPETCSATRIYTYLYTDECSDLTLDFIFTYNIDISTPMTCPEPMIVCVTDDPFLLTELGEDPTGGSYSGPGVDENTFDPSIAGAGLHVITYAYTNDLECVNYCTFNITVNAESGCDVTSMMRWVLLPATESGCGSVTDCCSNTYCYGLEYTPGYTGYLNNYTAGFFIDCPGSSPLLDNTSCVMENNSFDIDECIETDLILVVASGNGGDTLVTAGVPIIIHKICITVPVGEIVNVLEDNFTDLATGIDLIGGGFADEFPEYEELTVDNTPFDMPANDGDMVDYPEDTDTEPIPPQVFDRCGNEIIPAEPVISTPIECQGSRTYTFTYTDCKGTMQDWVFTYTVAHTTEVTNKNDAGGGSLRFVIGCADSGETITFDATELMDETIILTSGEIVIDKDLFIAGLGKANLTISGNSSSRIFHLMEDFDLEITDLSLIDGSAAIDGGAILVEGNLTLEDVRLENNDENGTPKSLTLKPMANLTIIGGVELNE